MQRIIIFKKLAHIVLAIFSFALVYLIQGLPRLQATLFLVLGTFWLVDLLKILFIDSEYVNFGMFATLFVGSVLCLLFIIWLVNTVIKIFNPLFDILNWNFNIGNLFSDLYQYLFSIPALICGIVLIAFSINWDNYGVYRVYKFFYF